MTLIRLDTQAEVENHPTGDLDLQRITAWLGKQKFTIYNVYWPNQSFTQFPLKETTFKRTILAGDFNAHIPSLGYLNFNSVEEKWKIYAIPLILILFSNRTWTANQLFYTEDTLLPADLT